MTTYAAKHAELYDLLYAGKPYEAEARFVSDLLRSHAGQDHPVRRILDLACGTATHAVALCALGYEVLGVDASPHMLAVARSKAEETSGLRLIQQDMRHLDIKEDEGTPFDAAVCLFDSIGHVAETSGVEAALTSIWAHLRPGGVLVMEFWHGPAFLAGFERCRVRRLTMGHREILRVSETEIDLRRQSATVRYEFIERGEHAGSVSAFESVEVRFFGVEEIATLFRHAGFEPLAFYDGYSRSETLSLGSVHVLGVARRF